MKTKALLTTLVAGALCQFAGEARQAQDATPAPPAVAGTAGVKGPREVIAEKIKAEVAGKLAAAGASYDTLVVSVAVDRDSATPFKVSYEGLRSFTPPDGTAPVSSGQFIMEYGGGGVWRGTLNGMQFSAQIGSKDNIDLPFVDDAEVIGEWESVDFVADAAEFNPAETSWKGTLYLKGLTFRAGGKTPQPWWTWTKGVLIHKGDRTASRYEVRDVGGKRYLFLEWKSGDVTIAGMKPHYYVLRQKAG